MLDALEFDIQAGEITGLVGVNGAGKTTLIKCLLDLRPVSAGRIEIFGVPHAEPGARADLAYLPERFTAPYFATGAGFLDFLHRMYGVSPAPDALADALAAVDLDPAALRMPVRALSKGMGQKLGLVGCLSSGRGLWLLDEPFSGLDPLARGLFRRHLQGLRGSGRTVIFTSHALADIEAVCDRLAVLHAGRLVFCGTPAEFRARFPAAHVEDSYLACIGRLPP
ncbi:MAG: ABC transporter ATP-binding protein [Gammaproteobacteria bacterium]